MVLVVCCSCCRYMVCLAQAAHYHGFAAKGMCSSVFLAGKTPERVEAEDLSFFPISLAKCTIDYEEKSVTARVLGLAKRKAVFREGLGCCYGTG